MVKLYFWLSHSPLDPCRFTNLVSVCAFVAGGGVRAAAGGTDDAAGRSPCGGVWQLVAIRPGCGLGVSWSYLTAAQGCAFEFDEFAALAQAIDGALAVAGFEFGCS